MEQLESRLLLTTFTWTGVGGAGQTSFFDGSNWDQNGATPGAGDDVVFAIPAAVDLAGGGAAPQINNMTVQGGATVSFHLDNIHLTLSGDLIVDGSAHLTIDNPGNALTELTADTIRVAPTSDGTLDVDGPHTKLKAAMLVVAPDGTNFGNLGQNPPTTSGTLNIDTGAIVEVTSNSYFGSHDDTGGNATINVSDAATLITADTVITSAPNAYAQNGTNVSVSDANTSWTAHVLLVGGGALNGGVKVSVEIADGASTAAYDANILGEGGGDVSVELDDATWSGNFLTLHGNETTLSATFALNSSALHILADLSIGDPNSALADDNVQLSGMASTLVTDTFKVSTFKHHAVLLSQGTTLNVSGDTQLGGVDPRRT
jgi:hypothetical protein